jgi:3-deoxy-manno-octulosonate cytidylyltransferase (CMP-KDO synthetase)
MKVLGIIPSRYESSRFSGKPLIDLKGKSMIQRVYEQANKSEYLTTVVVATDDQRIFDHVKEFGGEVFMTSANHPSGTDRCGEVALNFPEMDVIVNIQGDEPLIVPAQLDQLAALFEDKKIQIGTLAKKIDDVSILSNPNRIKVALGDNNKALYFSRSAIPFLQGKEMNEWLNHQDYYRHIGVYAYRNDILSEIVKLKATIIEKQESLEQLRWLYYGYSIHVAFSEYETPNIDVPEDVKAVLDLLD